MSGNYIVYYCVSIEIYTLDEYEKRVCLDIVLVAADLLKGYIANISIALVLDSV